MAVDIQPRDRRIMRHVFSFRVMSYGQVRSKFFPKRFETVARNRINKLVKGGYFRTFVAEKDGKNASCLGLAEKSWPLIAEKWDFEVDKPHFRSESIEHDLRLVDVALKFESLKLFEKFYPENVLQSSSSLAADPRFRDIRNLQSDGALILKDNRGGRILYAVEFEISKKSPDRYIQKLGAYYKAGGIDGVLYVCGNKEIADLIARSDRKARTGKDSIVYLAGEASVLKSDGKIIFRGVDQGGIAMY